MEDRCYEVIVVGAGVQGSSTAYYLACKARITNVLLLDQFSASNGRGSSGGSSRIIRRAYAYPFYVKMMEEAFPMWSDLEREESQSTLYIKTGLLAFGHSQNERVQNMIDILGKNNLAHEKLSGKEINQRYSKQLSLPDDYIGVLEYDGGILRASTAVQALQKMFVSAGGDFKEEHQVTGILPGEVITVNTNKGSFKTKRLIITAGPWTNKLLKCTSLQLPLKVVRTEAVYWKVSHPDHFSCDNFHTFISCVEGDNGDQNDFYSLPIKEYPGLLKVCYHSGPETEPDSRDLRESFSSPQLISEFISKHMKGVATTPSIVEPCMYTMSPDHHPIMDRHPNHHNIVIGAGFSGHGFKLGPVVGKILSELSLGLHTSYDLSPFKISRFSAPVKCNL